MHAGKTVFVKRFLLMTISAILILLVYLFDLGGIHSILKNSHVLYNGVDTRTLIEIP